MSAVDRYIEAATRENTRRSYQSAIRHFEVEWGGFLPASADEIARYLADHAQSLSVNTLRARLAALAQWHQTQGFPDPTKTPHVRKVIKGIAALHPVTEKRARPLQLAQLERLAAWLDGQIREAEEHGDTRMRLTHLRNRALVLLGFWRGFRSDELSRLRIEHIAVEPARGMTLFLPRTKGDRAQLGTTFKAPALSRLCPVAAYEAWIAASSLTEGPVFRSVDRWGNVSDAGLHAGSFVPLLRTLFRAAGLPAPDSYSSHSLRRGFATWANSNGWDLKMLMEYVGWKDVRSAMRYIDAADPFAQHRIESALTTMPPPAPTQPAITEPAKTQLLADEVTTSSTPHTHLNLHLVIERNSKFVRGMSKARRWIEDFCHSLYEMRCVNRQRTRYEITMPFAHGAELEAAIEELLGEIHFTAEMCNCMAEAVLHDPVADRYWR
ncbi:site-specific integrase [Burkholderia vietnamiensis]|jgi:integrase|uniref:Site-specific integrase n=2 Tax=Burkholderia cepacia complex TaxID=87882 RepID=A0AAW7T335_BURVI|nr:MULTISPECIES: site-specific integrase [Burkholderia]AXK68108.1 Tn3 family resolvase [Burkholderia sp. IDO3]MBH9646506.1 site-specific integrase [Burkholderia vietnamiensis]MBR8009145.1 site-specific integrase [Burkholderia vietnamiensis]MBR8174255.1 site-specific integrase [Burkholderia cenocepacia]MBR8190470.1 site-specific integrase [Burkholderia vietnamiensis]